MVPNERAPRRAAWRLMLVACVAAAIAHAPAAAQDQPGSEPARVILRLPIPLNYEANPEALESALNVVGERTVTVGGGDSLSKIISTQYRVGGSNAPTAFALFRDKVLALNGLRGSDLLRRGQAIRLPDLPRLALTAPGPNPFNLIPKLAVDASLLSGSATPSDGLVVSETGRPAAQNAVLLEEMSVETAKAVLAASGGATVESADLTVSFEQAADGGGVYSLEPGEAALIRTKLAGAAKQRPVLIILDDAWPDDEAFRRSRDFFGAAITKLRQRYKIEDKAFSPSLVNATSAPWRWGAPTKVSHAQEIQSAIAPFRELESAGERVQVIYLPMFTRQAGAAEIFEHLIALNQVVQTRHDAFEDKMPKDVVTAARAVATSVVAKLDKTRSTDVASTDVALVQAVFKFCAYYSATVRSACFVNLSWITPKLWFDPVMPDAYYGELVAAAGNRGAGGGSTLYSGGWQFAVRSSTPPADVLAVMNIDATGQPACDSTVFGSSLQYLFVVGFDGAVAPSVCGTSFAAPRVAWMLAAREAMLTPPADARAWRQQLWGEVVGNYDPSATAYNQVRFSIHKFMAKIP